MVETQSEAKDDSPESKSETTLAQVEQIEETKSGEKKDLSSSDKISVESVPETVKPTTLPTSDSFAKSEPSVSSPITQSSSTEGAVTPSLDEKSKASASEVVLDPCTLAQGYEELKDSKAKTPEKETVEEVSKKAEEEVEKWGKPLGLPSPLPPGGSSRSLNNETNNKKSASKRSERKITPVYMDLAYVPHHGDANYTDIEFFKRVRARYYVFSGVEPSRAVFDALLEGKKTWENKDLGNSIIYSNADK